MHYELLFGILQIMKLYMINGADRWQYWFFGLQTATFIMKLSICLMLAVVAAASADQGFYQPQPVAHHSAPSSYATSGTGNYYDYPPQPQTKLG